MPSVDNAPDDHRRYLSPGALPFYHGRAEHEGEDGEFYHFSENHIGDVASLYGQQPAFYQPRAKWEHGHPNTPLYLNTDDDDQLISQKPDDGRSRSLFTRANAPMDWAMHAGDLWQL
ncbi:hypothetical protein FALBO_132 [Fusarium albosuccineum]|uniref:Uncharacterized protein n=1 Tax=Fusarium albosuccineum TaxID=1237068 RepID=A0A8H4LRP2_9HYPO|nr:hypothetical protein FALBO_132 [Fusarium albosuccineum]